MTLYEAINLIRPGVIPLTGTWADIGAGTGLFTEALMEILEEGKIISLDKSPHGLYANKQLAMGYQQRKINEGQVAIGKKAKKINIEIVEADFNIPLDLPLLDGILMANALHYANDHKFVLKNVLTSLKPEGTFLLIEYDTEKPNPPWVPNPISLHTFRVMCKQMGLKDPVEIGRRQSIYQDGEMYAVMTHPMDTDGH